MLLRQSRNKAEKERARLPLMMTHTAGKLDPTMTLPVSASFCCCQCCSFVIAIGVPSAVSKVLGADIMSPFSGKVDQREVAVLYCSDDDGQVN